jgi:uncharacterized protein (DUF1330 family)
MRNYDAKFLLLSNGRLRGEEMTAYIVFTRERTRDEAQLDQYKKLVSRSFQQHPAIIRTIHGRHEVLEGPALEEIIILEFPTYEEAKSWYHSPEYQAACEHRFQGGDYRCIITEGQS